MKQAENHENQSTPVVGIETKWEIPDDNSPFSPAKVTA